MWGRRIEDERGILWGVRLDEQNARECEQFRLGEWTISIEARASSSSSSREKQLFATLLYSLTGFVTLIYDGGRLRQPLSPKRGIIIALYRRDTTRKRINA